MKPQDFDIEKNAAEWGSFLPTLQAVLEVSVRPVLEVGVGFYSTPMLHKFCAAAKRPLVSIEEDPEWFDYFSKAYAAEGHHFAHGNYDQLLPLVAGRRWGVIFMDHSPGPRRGRDVDLLLDWADFIVVHDYHLAIMEEIGPRVAIHHRYIADKTQPPTLVVSKQLEIPGSVLSL